MKVQNPSNSSNESIQKNKKMKILMRKCNLQKAKTSSRKNQLAQNSITVEKLRHGSGALIGAIPQFVTLPSVF